MFQRLKHVASLFSRTMLQMLKGRLAWWEKQGLIHGYNLQFGEGCSFGAEPYLVTIHDNVRLSSNVQFITHDGSVHTIRANESIKGEYQSINKYGKIEVGDNTFIGANATILPGVYIGSNCVIGAGSIITRSIPDYSVAAGVPARVICGLDDYIKKTVSNVPTNWNDEEFHRDMRGYLVSILPEPKQNNWLLSTNGDE